DLRPVLLRAAGPVERLPDLPDEEVDEGAGGGVGLAAQLVGDVKGRLGTDAELDQGPAGALQARADRLDLAVGQFALDAELFAAPDHLRVQLLRSPDLGQLPRLEDFRRLVLERGAHGAG